MTDKRFQHFPSGNNNITTILQPPVAAEAMQPSCPSSVTAMQKFVFEFGSDGNIHSVSFLGNLSHEDIRLMLESVRRELYADCGSAIYSYLKQNNMPYSGLKTEMIPLKNQEIMERARRFLQSCSPEDFDVRICRTDNYYAVMDQQVRTPDGGCEGCYYAVRKSADNKGFQYRIVGQTYACSRPDDTDHGYFAVRTGRDSQKFLNLDTKTGEPVFPLWMHRHHGDPDKHRQHHDFRSGKKNSGKIIVSRKKEGWSNIHPSFPCCHFFSLSLTSSF